MKSWADHGKLCLGERTEPSRGMVRKVPDVYEIVEVEVWFGSAKMSLGNGSDARPDRPFDGHQFYLDLTRELRRVRYPYYPEEDFFRALAYADREDLARRVKSRNDELDIVSSQRQNFRYVVRFEESDWLSLDRRARSGKHAPIASHPTAT